MPGFGPVVVPPKRLRTAIERTQYLEIAGIADKKDSPLWRSTTGRTRELTDRAMTRVDVYRMVKRRCRAAGLPDDLGNHTFRATGITAYLANGGTLENAQLIAGHESPRTTKLYDRTTDKLTHDEIERIAI